MASANLVVRLAVGCAEGPNSATLRIWSPKGKSDVYASVRERAGDFKVSLHESGECNAGLTKQFAENETDAMAALGGERHQSKWRRAQHSGLRVVTPLQFAFPASELRTWREAPVEDKAITWIDPPPQQHTIIVSLIFSGDELTDDKWPGRNNGTNLIDTKLLPNGEKFWLLWQECPTTTLEESLLNEARKIRKERVPVRFSAITDDTPPGPRITIFKEFPQDNLLVVLEAAADTLET